MSDSELNIHLINQVKCYAMGEDIALVELFANSIPLLPTVSIGRYCWMIIGSNDLVVRQIGGDIEYITGSKPEDLLTQSEVLTSISHPEDAEAIFQFLLHVLNVSVGSGELIKTIQNSIFFRVLLKNHQQRWTMMKLISEQKDEETQGRYGLLLISDISHLKQSGHLAVTVLDSLTNSFQIFYPGLTKVGNINVTMFTKREIQILRYVSQGYASKQIAFFENISIKTVENHRRNMLEKSGCPSSTALVMFAVQNGFI